ncbi:MAG: hypothetical protein DLM61_08180 [Pseudonocardiales bacterium]|nr:MAG: hypothetical protein DLM61_08180 [Pseudonocardiales bacterium]
MRSDNHGSIGDGGGIDPGPGSANQHPAPRRTGERTEAAQGVKLSRLWTLLDNGVECIRAGRPRGGS